VNWLKKWLKPSAPANSDAMNWAEQWLNRSQWFKDKHLKERYLVAEAVLHALSDPDPRVDLPLPYADMDEFIRALLDLEKIAGKNLFHPQQPNATPIWRTWLNLSHPDGRIREQTLHTLPARIPSTLYAILVLLRLNDWAIPVRAAVRCCLADFAAATDPRHLAAALTHFGRHHWAKPPAPWWQADNYLVWVVFASTLIVIALLFISINNLSLDELQEARLSKIISTIDVLISLTFVPGILVAQGVYTYFWAIM